MLIHLVLLCVNTAIPLVRKAKRDGKVTVDEVVDIVENVANTATEELEKIKEEVEINDNKSN